MDKQYYYALSFVNTDSKGIVADTTKVLFDMYLQNMALDI